MAEAVTSVHPLNQALLAKGRLWKVWWWSVSAADMIALICLTGLLVSQYKQDETSATTKLIRNKRPFPAVTLCNLNPYKKSVLEAVPELSDLLLSPFDSGTTNYNKSDKNVNERKKRQSLGINPQQTPAPEEHVQSDPVQENVPGEAQPAPQPAEQLQQIPKLEPKDPEERQPPSAAVNVPNEISSSLAKEIEESHGSDTSNGPQEQQSLVLGSVPGQENVNPSQNSRGIANDDFSDLMDDLWMGVHKPSPNTAQVPVPPAPVLNTNPQPLPAIPPVETADPHPIPQLPSADPSPILPVTPDDPPAIPSVTSADPPAIPSVTPADPPAIPSVTPADPPAIPSVTSADPPAIPSVTPADPPAIPSVTPADPPAISLVTLSNRTQNSQPPPVIPAVTPAYPTPNPSLILPSDLSIIKPQNLTKSTIKTETATTATTGTVSTTNANILNIPSVFGLAIDGEQGRNDQNTHESSGFNGQQEEQHEMSLLPGLNIGVAARPNGNSVPESLNPPFEGQPTLNVFSQSPGTSLTGSGSSQSNHINSNPADSFVEFGLSQQQSSLGNTGGIFSNKEDTGKIADLVNSNMPKLNEHGSSGGMLPQITKLDENKNGLGRIGDQLHGLGQEGLKGGTDEIGNGGKNFGKMPDSGATHDGGSRNNGMKGESSNGHAGGNGGLQTGDTKPNDRPGGKPEGSDRNGGIPGGRHGGNERPGGNDRPGGSDRPGDSDRPGGNGRPGGSDRSGGNDRPGGSDRSGGNDRPGERPGGSDRSGGNGRPGGSDRSGGNDRPGERPGGSDRSGGNGRPGGSDRSGGNDRPGERPGGSDRSGGNGRPGGSDRSGGNDRPGERPGGSDRSGGNGRPGGSDRSGGNDRPGERPGGSDRSGGNGRPGGSDRSGGNGRPGGSDRSGGNDRPGERPGGSDRSGGNGRLGGRPEGNDIPRDKPEGSDKTEDGLAGNSARLEPKELQDGLSMKDFEQGPGQDTQSHQSGKGTIEGLMGERAAHDFEEIPRESPGSRSLSSGPLNDVSQDVGRITEQNHDLSGTSMAAGPVPSSPDQQRGLAQDPNPQESNRAEQLAPGFTSPPRTVNRPNMAMPSQTQSILNQLPFPDGISNKAALGSQPPDMAATLPGQTPRKAGMDPTKNTANVRSAVVDQTPLSSPVTAIQQAFKALPPSAQLDSPILKRVVRSIVEQAKNDTATLTAVMADTTSFVMSSLPVDVITQSSYTLSDVILHCEYNGIPCSNKDFERYIDPNYGNCYTFNWNGIHSIGHSAGAMSGLTIFYDTKQNEYLQYTLTAGARVVVHVQNEPVIPDTSGIYAPPGYQTAASIKMIQTNLLSLPSRTCVTLPSDVPSFYYNGTYSVEACLRSCYQDTVIEKCGCTDPRIPSPPDSQLPQCSLTKRNCVDENFNAGDGSCLCPPSCQTAEFEITQMLTSWPISQGKTMILQDLVGTFNRVNMIEKTQMARSSWRCDEKYQGRKCKERVRTDGVGIRVVTEHSCALNSARVEVAVAITGARVRTVETHETARQVIAGATEALSRKKKNGLSRICHSSTSNSA